MEENELDGVDFNWEYPRDQNDWNGLFLLFKELKEQLEPINKIITMAYYPDHNQEMILSQGNAQESINFFHSMSYDTYQQHSTIQFAQQTINNAKEFLPVSQVTLGLPFYGRNIANGMPRTYQEIVPQIKNYRDDMIQFPGEQGMQFFNSKETIKQKIKMAKENGLGGIMIWEIGQDIEFEREESLLRAIYEELLEENNNQNKNEL